MVLSTSQMRSEHGAPCKVKVWRGAQEAWDGLVAWMEYYGYKLRQADTGSRSCRPITGGTNYSLHAYFLDVNIRLWNLGVKIAGGLAADFNWQTNPYGPRLVTDMLIRKDGILMPDRIEGIRTNSGKQVFRWGGYYRGNKDAMHYELVCSDEDLATGINPSTVPSGLDQEEEDMPGKNRVGDDGRWWIVANDAQTKRYIVTPGHAVVAHREGTLDSPTPIKVEQAWIDEIPVLVTDGWIRQVTLDLLGKTRDEIIDFIKSSNTQGGFTDAQVDKIISAVKKELDEVSALDPDLAKQLKELTPEAIAKKVIEEIAS